MIKRREEASAVRSQLNAATAATVATDVATGLDMHAFTAFVSSSGQGAAVSNRRI